MNRDPAGSPEDIIWTDRNVTTEVKRHKTKGKLYGGIINYMSTKIKIKVQKTTVRPIKTYAAETRAENKTGEQNN